MTDEPPIREGRAEDAAALERLTAAAFPEEDLRPLVRALAKADTLFLVAEAAGAPDGAPHGVPAGASPGTLAGYAVFAPCRVGDVPVALLGPVAVAPERQRSGIGSALIRAGLERLGGEGTVAVLVLGDPAYYARFGFAPQGAIAAPYPMPAAYAAAWQGLSLADAPLPSGRLEVPAPWRDAALWDA